MSCLAAPVYKWAAANAFTSKTGAFPNPRTLSEYDNERWSLLWDYKKRLGLSVFHFSVLRFWPLRAVQPAGSASMWGLTPAPGSVCKPTVGPWTVCILSALV